MDDERHELVRVDATGTAHAVGKTASQRLRARQGAFRMMPSPPHLIVMRFVGEDGRRDEVDGPIFRLAGEITTGGALCDVVALIGHAGWRGELVVLEGESSRSLFFDQGNVVGSHSTAEGERLGEVLYRYGALTKEQVETTAKAVTSEIRFGEAAVKLGFLTRERLFQLIGKQTEETTYAVLRVSDGMFYFLDGFEEARLTSRQNFPVSALLMEGVRRMDETKYFRERIPSDQHVPEKLPQRQAPPTEFKAVYDAIDGARCVAEIGRVIGQGEFEVTQALFQLIQSGHVSVHAPRPTGPAAMIARFNEAMALVFREVGLVSKAGEVREQLSSFATGAGIYDALFSGAGPHEDGTMDAERVVANVGVLVGPDEVDAMLAQWLYEYASFALFIAEPFLRGEASPFSRRTDGQQSLARRIAELLVPLAPGRLSAR